MPDFPDLPDYPGFPDPNPAGGRRCGGKSLRNSRPGLSPPPELSALTLNIPPCPLSGISLGIARGASMWRHFPNRLSRPGLSGISLGIARGAGFVISGLKLKLIRAFFRAFSSRISGFLSIFPEDPDFPGYPGKSGSFFHGLLI